MRKLYKAILGFLVRVVFRAKLIDADNLPKEGAIMLFGNHIHALDAPSLVLTAKRQVIFLAKEELFKYKILKHLGDVFECISLKRDAADMEAMKATMRSIKEGKVVGIFPEGTRNGMAKNVELKTGGSYMALKAGISIIPVGIVGEFKPFKKVYIKYGKPMNFNEKYGNKPTKEELETITKEVMAEVVKLRDSIQVK